MENTNLLNKISNSLIEKLTEEDLIQNKTNPQDVIKVDVPLFIRLLEYAHEDAKTDMDLHNITENIVKLSSKGDVLGMDSYNQIVKNSLDEIISYNGSSWLVKSKDGKRVLGSHKTKEDALKQLRTIEISKHSIQEDKSNLKKYINYLNEILEYCCNELQVPRPKVNIILNEKYTQEHNSFGGYKPGKNEIDLVIKNRTCSDSGRTLVHEVRHLKQDLDGVLTNESGKDGSEHENECNAFAGKVMREYNRKYPEILTLKV